MGHERLGVLPKSRKWRAIVAEIASSSAADSGVVQIASATLQAVEKRFEHIHQDSGVQAAFEFLIGLANAALPSKSLEWSDFNVEIAADPSALRLAKELREWVRPHVESHEYSELAIRAATDAIAVWYSDHTLQASLLVGSRAQHAWTAASSGAGFCELARLFFARFTERYLKYFLEREASAALATIRERELFSAELRGHVDSVSRHAFETARITQSFAAGWFNKRARGIRPSRPLIEAFLRTCLGKIREEFVREGRAT